MINWALQCLFIYCGSIAVAIVVLRLVFGVGKFLRYQKAQTRLLAEIALKNNVDPILIDEIKKEAKI